MGLAAVVGRSADAGERGGVRRRDPASRGGGVRGLPAAQRETCSLRLLGDLSLDEIARVTRVPVGTVKSRLFHGLRRLRALLADIEPER